MKAELGDNVGLHYDTDAVVLPGHIIRTSTGRCYRVTHARRQAAGIHAGRYHLRCTVVARAKRGQIIHPLFWYRR